MTPQPTHVPIVCANCDTNFLDDSQPISEIKIELPSQSVKNKVVTLKVKDAMSLIYNLSLQYKSSQKEEIGLCRECGVVFETLSKAYLQFNHLRKVGSYLSRQISNTLQKLQNNNNNYNKNDSTVDNPQPENVDHSEKEKETPSQHVSSHKNEQQVKVAATRSRNNSPNSSDEQVNDNDNSVEEIEFGQTDSSDEDVKVEIVTVSSDPPSPVAPKPDVPMTSPSTSVNTCSPVKSNPPISTQIIPVKPKKSVIKVKANEIPKVPVHPKMPLNSQPPRPPKDIYSCPHCDKKYHAYHPLTTHLLIHGEPTKKCSLCPNTYKTTQELNAHESLAHPEIAPKNYHKCSHPNCEASFPSHSRLEKHMAKHTGQKLIMEYTCQTCSEKFSSWKKLDLHKEDHIVNPFVCNKPRCTRKFETSEQLAVHSNVCQGSPNPIKCSVCGKEFKQPSQLKSHLISHTKEKNCKCEYPGCDTKYSRQFLLAIHVRRAHTLEKPFKCPQEGCDKAFCSKKELRDHKYEHETSLCLCELCGKSYKTLDILRTHKLKHKNEKRFVCELCGEQGMDKKEYKVHMLGRHKDEKTHECGVCGKKFAMKSSLGRHSQSHKNDKPSTSKESGNKSTKSRPRKRQRSK